jgi:D-alanyl-D-alanine carboxypeptidase/D-alanyl-D-alanine-endopeptidase (penicillin-binding protein 4)
MRAKFRFLFVPFLFLFLFSVARAETLPSWAPQVTALVEHGGVYVEAANGKVLFDYNGSQGFMPASTMKLITGLISLELLTPDYRFKTDFFLDKSNSLYVKGFGDPFLVSEEFPLIVAGLKRSGLQKVNGIFLDDSYFETVKVPGASQSLNPYDALNSSLSANFNTINVQKSGDSVESAEPQTPVTDLTRLLAQKAPPGKSRINLAAHPEESLLYVGHLLKAFLEKDNIPVSGNIQKGRVPDGAPVYYSHHSSKKLDQVIQPMMKYSTNFITNQLFLTMGAEKYGPPATLAKGKKLYTEFLQSQLGFTNFNVDEGSGLSRENRFSPAQMVKVLKAFEKYKNLLPEKLDSILAKTGTLTGVNCLAGYFDTAQYGTVRFAIMLNQAAVNREKIAKILYANLH